MTIQAAFSFSAPSPCFLTPPSTSSSSSSPSSFHCSARRGYGAWKMPCFLSAGKNGASGMAVCRIGRIGPRCGGRSDGDADGGGNGRSELNGASVGRRRDDDSGLCGGASFWTRYTSLLQSHPLVVKSLTTGLLNAIADIICQVVLEKVDYFDVKRLLSFTTIGLFLSGPGLHFWYGMLPKLISVPGIGGVVLRTAADQLIFTPLAMGSLFVVLLFLEGRNDQIMTKLQQLEV